jgi:DNA (cytosine-5)-methyltransferase 1
MRILNLYAGIGGNRKLWEDVDVTAVEWNEEIARVYSDNFPLDRAKNITKKTNTEQKNLF